MDRYSRHSNLFSPEQFQKIKTASVMVAGIGGLGCAVLQNLARIGMGKIYLYDYAHIDLPDLNRHTLFTEDDLGKYKARCAAEKVNEINQETEVAIKIEKIDVTTNLPMVDVVFDCLDSFKSRLDLDQLLYSRNIPMISAVVDGYLGHVTSIVPGKSIALNNRVDDVLLEDKIASKSIFPSIVMIAAAIQTSEAIKYLTGAIDKMATDKAIKIDLLNNSFQ